MVTVATVRLMHPEFKGAADAFIQAFLDEAASELDAEIFGDKYDAATRWLALHKMALSPMGMSAKLVDSKGNSTYNIHYESIARTVSSGFRVAWPT